MNEITYSIRCGFASMFLSLFLFCPVFGAEGTTLEGVAIPFVPQEESPLTETEVRVLRDAHEASGAKYVRAIAKNHVNLLRISGEAISDVVYDTGALEIEPDKARGIVFLRVKPQWVATGKTRTAAFFTTANESYGVTFLVSDVPSQTIVIAGKGPDEGERAKGAIPALGSLESLRSDSHVQEMKTLVRKAALFRGSQVKNPRETTTVFSEDDPGFVRVRGVGNAIAFEGFELRQTALYASDTRFVESFRVRNMRSLTRAIPLGKIAKVRSGILAIAASKTELEMGQSAVLYLVSSRLADPEPRDLGGMLKEAAR